MKLVDLSSILCYNSSTKSREVKKMFKITYNRKGQISRCEYETTDYALFEKTLEELTNDNTVSNITIE